MTLDNGKILTGVDLANYFYEYFVSVGQLLANKITIDNSALLSICIFMIIQNNVRQVTHRKIRNYGK